MWSTEVSQLTSAQPSQIWSKWSDVKNWKKWDHEIEWSELHGPFAVGTLGKLKPKGGPTTRFVATEVTPESRFSDRSQLPFAYMNFIHILAPEDGQTRVTHRIEIGGPLGFLFAKILGPKLKSGLSTAVGTLISQAERGI